MSIKEDVKEMALRVPSPPCEEAFAGTNHETISDLEKRIGIVVPLSLREWLCFANGPCIGPGGVLGIRPERHWLDIEEVLQSYPSWKGHGWLPVAGDGCGNYYVINTCECGSVYFVDTAMDADKLAYAVASDLWMFLWFLFNHELGDTRWPFTREYVVANDPRIMNCSRAPLPWNA